MTRFFVNIHLEILVIHKETTALLINCEVRVVPLCEHVGVVSMCKLCLHFDRLTVKMWPTYRMNVAEVAILTTFSKPGLYSRASRL